MTQKQIFALINKFKDSGLTELELESEGFRLVIKDEKGIVNQQSGFAPAAPGIQQPVAGTPADGQTASAQTEADDTEIITSPIVGTFYRSPAPDAPPFVEEGSIVKSGDSLCIIEAMKIMNKLEAEFSCEIVSVLAENGQMVEYGTPLFKVKKK
jgi:acetyl-CoA carboxylase biotin carboxyl carrier protein